jgi:hypothetical protein
MRRYSSIGEDHKLQWHNVSGTIQLPLGAILDSAAPWRSALIFSTLHRFSIFFSAARPALAGRLPVSISIMFPRWPFFVVHA